MSSLFPNGITGLSDSKWSGAPGSVYRAVGLDLHSTPGLTKVHQKLSLAGLFNGLVSYWALGEASGTRVDSHGDNDLTDNNTVSSDTGKQGDAAAFEADNSEYLSITDAAQSGLAFTNKFSFACWVNFESTSGFPTILSKYIDDAQNRAYKFYFGSNKLRLSVAGQPTQTFASVDWTPSTSTWYHLAVSYDGVAGEIKFYVNGAQQGTTQSSSTTTLTESSQDVRVGASFNITTGTVVNFFDGLIDELGAWNRVLSSDEITKLYNATSGLSYSDITDNEVDELCKHRVACSDGSTLWFSSESGKIWRENNGVWTLVYTTALSAEDLFTAVYESKQADVSAAVGNQASIHIKSDGSKMFVLGLFDDTVYGYDLTTDWDISTATADDSYAFTTQVSAAAAFFVRANGTKMYICSNAAVFQYSLTAWDASTASYDSKTFNPTEVTTNLEGIWFKDDGTKMYIMASEVVYQYTLSTAWDVSTASYDSVSYDTTADGTSFSECVAFNDDGDRMYVTDLSDHAIYQYDLGTAWDLSTVSFDSFALFDAAGDGPLSLFLRPTGESVYVSYANDGLIRQYSLADGTEEVKTLGASEFYALNLNSSTISSEHIYWATEFYLFRIPIADLASWSGNVEVIGEFANGDDTYHPMIVQNLELFIGDDTVIAKVATAGTFTDETDFNIQAPERIQTLIDFDTDLLVGTKKVTIGRVLRWDTVSESWSAEDTIEEAGVNAFIRDDNYVFAQVGDFGRLYFYNGEKMELYKRIPGEWTPSKKGKINQSAVATLLGVPVFGLSNVTGNPALQGVYSFGSYSKDYPKILDLSFPISTGDFEGVEIGAVLVSGADMWVAWKVGSTAGVDKLDWSNKYASAYIETVMLTALEQRSVYKAVARFYASYASLPANTDVSFKYKKKHEAAYSAALATKKDAELLQVRTDAGVPKIANLQLRFDVTVSGNNAPEFEDFGLDMAIAKKGI